MQTRWQEGAMAKILQFPASRQTASDGSGQRAAKACRSAEIVIFPGIRYEHWSDAVQADETCAARAIERDTLQLAE
jgi:hypothetical protein